MSFKIIIKDFDTFTLLQDKTIKIINLDTKEQMSGTSNFEGEIIFNISEDQKADFFNVLLSDDSGEYEKEPYYLAEENVKNQKQTITKKTTQKILTPRNYETHPAILYFKKKENIVVGILKAYCSKDEEKIYNYYLDYQDEIFVADKNEEVKVCAYFYEDIEKDKLVSQKQREIDNNASCDITWTINEKKLNKNKYFGKQISFKPSEFGCKNGDIVIIKAYCNENNIYCIKHKENYKEPYRADGTDFYQKHTIIDALGVIALKIEDKWTLSYFDNKFLLMQNRTKKFIEFHTKEYAKLQTLKESFERPNYKATLTRGNNCCYIAINNQLSFKATTTYEQLNNLALLMQNLNTNILELPFYYYKESKYLINIKRYSQNTCYTLSSYEILQKNINNEYEPIHNKDIAKGVILEPSGPDFILGGYNQRVPEGIYKIKPHTTNSESLRTYKDNQGNLSQTLPLIYNNEWVLGDFSKNQKLRSSILIHAGTNILESSLDRTEGCLLIGSSFEDKRLLPHNNDTFLQSQYDKIKNKLNSKETITQEEKQIIEKYNNASIRSLMHFIQEQGNSFEDFTIHIGNEFRKEEAREKAMEDDIPNNIIRIETQDGSGEFIEIIFPILPKEEPLIDVSYMFFGGFKALQSTSKVAKFFRAKSLTRDEVVKIIEKLQKGSNENIRLVKNKKELDELWQKLIKNATKLEEKYIPIKNHKTGQIAQEKLIRYELDDGTDIIYRTGSGSGGETINIYGKNPKLNKTIHIKP